MPLHYRSVVRTTAVGAALAAALLGFDANASLINDGSFESPPQSGGFTYRPVVAGVTFTNNAGVAGGTFSSATPPDGTQYGFLQSGGGVDGASQGAITFDVSGLTAGTTYNVSFFASLRSGYSANPVMVMFNALSLGTFTPPSATDFASFTSGSFTAGASTGSLEFLGTATAGDFNTAVDGIVINAVSTAPIAAIPEPAPIALLVLGAAGGLFARRRSAASTRV